MQSSVGVLHDIVMQHLKQDMRIDVECIIYVLNLATLRAWLLLALLTLACFGALDTVHQLTSRDSQAYTSLLALVGLALASLLSLVCAKLGDGCLVVLAVYKSVRTL